MNKERVVKKVITYGTFDLFHIGHLNLLKRAKALGSYLIVGVSSDAFNEVKAKRCAYSCADRCEIVSAIRFVDEVIVENSWEQKALDVQALGVDVFVMGDDWKGKFDAELEGLCEVVYLPRTADISTTKVKIDIRSEEP